MSEEPKVTLKASVAVQGKEGVKGLAAMIAYKKKTGNLSVDVSQGGAVAATFDEKIVVEEQT